MRSVNNGVNIYIYIYIYPFPGPSDVERHNWAESDVAILIRIQSLKFYFILLKIYLRADKHCYISPII
jgi:hypothetical protein